MSAYEATARSNCWAGAIKRVKGVRPHPSRRREAAAGGRKGEERADVRALSREELREIRGKRSVGVLVGGTRTGTVDDFAINIAIFEGRIKGSYL